MTANLGASPCAIERVPSLKLFFQWPVRAVARALSWEHPQVIAAILAHAEPEMRAQVLAGFTERLRNDVLLRLCASEAIIPLGERLLERAANAWLENPDTWLSEPIFGVHAAAAACARLPGCQMEAALDSIREYDPELEGLVGSLSREISSNLERAEIEEAMPLGRSSEARSI